MEKDNLFRRAPKQSRGYEPDPPLRMKPFVVGVIAFAAFGVVLCFVLWGTMHGLAAVNEKLEPSRKSPLATTQPIPPQPWLQPSLAQGDQPRQPWQDMNAFRDHENQTLESAATIDASTGTVRIPIETAMRILADRGVPTSQPAGGAK